MRTSHDIAAAAKALSPEVGLPDEVLSVSLGRQTFGIMPMDAKLAAERQGHRRHVLRARPRPRAGRDRRRPAADLNRRELGRCYSPGVAAGASAPGAARPPLYFLQSSCASSVVAAAGGEPHILKPLGSRMTKMEMAPITPAIIR